MGSGLHGAASSRSLPVPDCRLRGVTQEVGGERQSLPVGLPPPSTCHWLILQEPLSLPGLAKEEMKAAWS